MSFLMWHGMTTTAEARRTTLGQKPRTNWAYTTCQAMYGNGVRTGKEVIAAVHRLIQKVQAVGRAACFAVAVGATTPGAVAWLFAAATRPSAGTTTLASALPSPSYDLLLPAHSLVLSQRTEMLRKGGQKERRGTSLGKDLTNDNIEEKMGIPAKPIADRNKNADKNIQHT